MIPRRYVFFLECSYFRYLNMRISAFIGLYRYFLLDQAVKENILMQITNASQMVKREKDPHVAFSLRTDGKTLTYALEDDLKHEFLKLAIVCASVICCRVSPKQKALIYRSKPGPMRLLEPIHGRRLNQLR
ncbi:hypothetical protein CTI12_AA503980 [Artemisia annua]|uniref:Uncharacterized protein n=1 Tax=Artemisia annua TaxID=35608 RepID=A0A2U1LCY6_ARTAN|nr:hypothetical protein CTI12_AA503980 [Artemisia annua]